MLRLGLENCVRSGQPDISCGHHHYMTMLCDDNLLCRVGNYSGWTNHRPTGNAEEVLDRDLYNHLKLSRMTSGIFD